jgi:cytochrome P450
MQYKRKIYQRFNSDIFALVCLFDSDKVYLADPSIIMEIKVAKADVFESDMLIFSRVSRLSHAESLQREMGLYGNNIVSTTGDEWKLHRRITSRAFSPKTLQLVYTETMRHVRQMMATWERSYDGKSVCIEE